MGAIDDVNHLVMQCPSLQVNRNQMFNDISHIRDGYSRYLTTSGANILMILLGKPHPNIPEGAMEEIWLISAWHIAAMYRLKIKRGVG